MVWNEGHSVFLPGIHALMKQSERVWGMNFAAI
jgi:hypothetical protein